MTEPVAWHARQGLLMRWSATKPNFMEPWEPLYAVPAVERAVLQDVMQWIGERQMEMPTPLLLRVRAITDATADSA